MSHFYSEITEIKTLKIELEELDVSQDEKDHLSRLIDSSLHNTILDLILSELSEDEKKVFLDNLLDDDKDKIWQHLNKNIDKVEDKVKKAAGDLSQQLAEDIKEIKNENVNKNSKKQKGGAPSEASAKGGGKE